MDPLQIVPSISPQALADRLSQGLDSLQLVDVRERGEAAIVSLPGFQLFPLSQYADWSSTIHTQLDPHKETIVLCHHGIRSAQMCQWLMAQGFTQVKNLSGGIDAYAWEVDRTLPHY
jgi:rhodanese-related sulfurtransferase